jgi:phage gp29-like protein
VNIFNKITDVVTNLTASKNQPEQTKLDKNINEQAMTVSKQDIATLKQALISAQSVVNPSRKQLYEVYNNIVSDAHLSSIIQSRMKKVLSKPFRIVNEAGEEDEKVTKIFETMWFDKFMKLSLESMYYGYSLIQLGDIDKGKFKDITLIDRRHVKPELGIVVKNAFDVVGTSYADEPFNTWLIPVGEKKDLGILKNVAKILLFKQMTLSAFAQYVEIYGIPTRIGYSGSYNEDSRLQMVNMLQNMGSAAWGIFDKEDKVEIVDAPSGGGDIFKMYLDYIDAQVSKAVAGQTMTSDNGSSKSQATVHENMFEEIIESDMKFLQFVINDELLPRLEKLGFPIKGYSFKFDTTEYVSVKEKFDMVIGLSKNGYEVDLNYIIDNFGIPVTKKEIPTTLTKDSGNLSEEEDDTENFI